MLSSLDIFITHNTYLYFLLEMCDLFWGCDFFFLLLFSRRKVVFVFARVSVFETCRDRSALRIIVVVDHLFKKKMLL